MSKHLYFDPQYGTTLGTFRAWRKAVDRIIARRIGVGLDDMPDARTRDLFDEATAPAAAAAEILQQWADDGDIPQDLV